MKNELNKDEVIKIMQRQMIAFLILLIVSAVGFIYLSNEIIDLQHKVRTLTHELDYTKHRIDELEKTKIN